MKNKIKQTVLFFAILIALILSIQKVVDISYNKHSLNKINLLLEHKIDCNVMVWGSSVALVQIDPTIIEKETGLSCYNEGWHGTFFVQYNALMKEFLSYSKECKYMIVACDFDNLGKNELITRPDMYLSHLSNKKIYQSLYEIEPEKIWRAKYIPGYKFGLLNKIFYKGVIGLGERRNSLKGYEPYNCIWDKSADSAKTFYARFDDHIYIDLKKTINEITSKGIKVILISPPVYAKGYALIQNAEQIKEKYHSLSDNNNVYYIDYTIDTICQNKLYFYNNSHMNIGGATKFSEHLAKNISQIINKK